MSAAVALVAGWVAGRAAAFEVILVGLAGVVIGVAAARRVLDRRQQQRRRRKPLRRRDDSEKINFRLR